ncbi:MAG TPA: response regulator [Sphingomicrobium sp.]|nr:response regulator [Sphingomicrobium sp.]
MSSRDSSTRSRRKPEAKAGLSGKRILVVEDSPVVAPFTADILGELGCDVIGPAPNMAAARELIEGEAIDGALMDVHIRGERVFPLCDLLESRGVPFILTSGYADWQIPEKLASRPRLQKPYTMEHVEKALAKLLR